MRRSASFLMLLLFACIAGNAKVVLPDIISSNMVLQQNTDVKLWGKAKPNTNVVVTTSWSDKKYTAKSDADGKWLLKVATPTASNNPQQITFSDGEKTVVDNILIGEVWFCSGQSNMEMPLGGFFNCPVNGANDEILYSAQNTGIRCVKIKNVAAVEPQTEVEGKWMVSNPENAVKFSATAFFFAKSVNKALGIPVGIIDCSWGGSKLEGWLPKEIVEKYDDMNVADASNKEIGDYAKPIIMYNGMVKPLQNYTIKGFLWYQGESNIGRHKSYAERMATMVELWRNEWGLGQLPFYYVEIAPYGYDNGDKNGLTGALVREAQYKALSIIPNSGMVCTNDLMQPYELYNIHPGNKQDVGKRLSYLALKNTYGFNNIYDRGPEYKSMEIKDSIAVLSFNNMPTGFGRSMDIEGFEVAGEDRVFYPATAKPYRFIQIQVSSPKVPKPVAVRYCFRNFQLGNFSNGRQLPLVPFRTDDWE